MKYYVLIIVALIIVCPVFAFAQNENQANAVERQTIQQIEFGIDNMLSDIDMFDIESIYDSYSDELFAVTNGKSFDEIIKGMASGNVDIDIQDVLGAILSVFFDEISKNIVPVLSIVVICAIFSILNDFGYGANKTQVKTAAMYAEYILVISIACKIMLSCFDVVIKTINGLSDFVQILFPILAALTASMGGIVSSAIFTPIIAFLTSFITVVIKNIFMPMVILIMIFSILNNISEKISITNFSSMIKSLVKWGLGILFVVFLGVVKIRGLVGGGFDGVSLKVTKFTISKVVPYIGGAISDTVDTVAVCALLLKNAVGISGLIIMFGVVLRPILNIAGCSILLRLTSSVLQPIGQKEVSNVLSDFADALSYALIIMIVISAMFFITISLIISTSNMNVMIR